MMRKQKISLLFDDEKGNLKSDKLVDYFISWLIIINMIAIVSESYPEINSSYAT